MLELHKLLQQRLTIAYLIFKDINRRHHVFGLTGVNDDTELFEPGGGLLFIFLLMFLFELFIFGNLFLQELFTNFCYHGLIISSLS
jgi:hypothetical protein